MRDHGIVKAAGIESVEQDCEEIELDVLRVSLDEVGRGCLAGPVATCASLWVDPLSLEASVPGLDPHGVQRLWIPLIRDSKKLTPRAREICFDAAAQSFEELKKENKELKKIFPL